MKAFDGIPAIVKRQYALARQLMMIGKFGA